VLEYALDILLLEQQADLDFFQFELWMVVS
jgi:hypothetical protein